MLRTLAKIRTGMTQQTLQINFEEYATPADLPPDERQLLELAVRKLSSSYAPYSSFQVSASALLSDGSIYTGNNFENAAYPMCLCAERTLLATCFSQKPAERILKVAITVRNVHNPVTIPASPCGACRQVFHETEQRQDQGIRLILRGESGPVWVFERSGDLLPFGFGGELL